MRIIAKHSRIPRKSVKSAKSVPAESVPPAEIQAPEAPKKRFSLEQRTTILESTKALLFDGLKIKEIAKKNDVPQRTLQLWVHNSDDAELIRLWVTSVLMEVDERFEKFDAKSMNAHIELATLREMMRRAWWYAEKRDRPRYGEDKVRVNLEIKPVLNITVAQEPARVIESEGGEKLPQLERIERIELVEAK